MKTFKIGDTFEIYTTGLDESEKCILMQTAPRKVRLFCVDTHNRWSDEDYAVNDMYNINLDEIAKIAGRPLHQISFNGKQLDKRFVEKLDGGECFQTNAGQILFVFRSYEGEFFLGGLTESLGKGYYMDKSTRSHNNMVEYLNRFHSTNPLKKVPVCPC